MSAEYKYSLRNSLEFYLHLSEKLPIYLTYVGELRFFIMPNHPLCHVIILGCGRSGTSIFGELFEHHPRPPDWKEWLSHPLLECCAHHRNHINSVGYATVAHPATVVRFDEMLADAVAFAKRVARQAGLVIPNVHLPLLPGATSPEYGHPH